MCRGTAAAAACKTLTVGEQTDSGSSQRNYLQNGNENNQYSPISTFHLHLASHTLAGGVKGHSSHSRLTGPFRIETSVI